MGVIEVDDVNDKQGKLMKLLLARFGYRRKSTSQKSSQLMSLSFIDSKSLFVLTLKNQ
jgi:hypothetical protein